MNGNIARMRNLECKSTFMCGSGEGGQGFRTAPGKSQVLEVSIGISNSTPPGKSWTILGKCSTPLKAATIRVSFEITIGPPL